MAVKKRVLRKKKRATAKAKVAAKSKAAAKKTVSRRRPPAQPEVEELVLDAPTEVYTAWAKLGEIEPQRSQINKRYKKLRDTILEQFEENDQETFRLPNGNLLHLKTVTTDSYEVAAGTRRSLEEIEL